MKCEFLCKQWSQMKNNDRVQYRIVLFSTVQCCAELFSAVKCNWVMCSRVHYSQHWYWHQHHNHSCRCSPIDELNALFITLALSIFTVNVNVDLDIVISERFKDRIVLRLAWFCFDVKNVHARLRGICMQLDAAILMFESMVLGYHFESQNVINRDDHRTPSFPTNRNFFTSEADRFDDGSLLSWWMSLLLLPMVIPLI